jgi:hypothetical protein
MNIFQFARLSIIRSLGFISACCVLTVWEISAQTNAPATDNYSFIVAGDMRKYIGPLAGGKRQFGGLCEAAKTVGPDEFMISPGDCDPPGPVRAAIDQYLGTNYLWYPVIGNHDADTPADMAWMRHWAASGIPHLVHSGPEGAELTIYSFDFGNSHFVALNDYYDGQSDAVGKGDVPDAALDWLKKDLSATRQPLIWVIGHKPIKSIPDMDSGRLRHGEDSVSLNPLRREHFVQLLKQFHVRAYICGHTHNCSITKVEGVWQADSGHARGAGDTGSPSTFLKFRIRDEKSWVDIYRSDTKGVEYRLRQTIELN